jgi:hypothetical protein
MVALFLTVVLAGCDATWVRRPMRRSDQYSAVIAEYKMAAVLPSETDKENGHPVWNRPLPADSPVRPTVTGRAHMDIIKVNYPDAPEPLIVHPPEDYTTNLEVGVKGSTLYVYRAVILLWTEYRLAVYDLANRKLLVDLLVAPEDMPARSVTCYFDRSGKPVLSRYLSSSVESVSKADGPFD